MTSLDDIKAKWGNTFARGSSLTSLREGVRYNGSQSPCVAGYRSLCWKIFLLFGDRPASEWTSLLAISRMKYSEQRDNFLKFIHHPESLSTITADPLDDDPKSPWNTAREDESIRDEIEQDVRRLPDEAFYHQPHVQIMVSDILFMYCKLNPTTDGYRQGMHELVAPLVLVLSADAVDCKSVTATAPADLTMLDILDQAYVEHDAFAIFTRIMKNVGIFYEVNKASPRPQTQSGPLPVTANISSFLSPASNITPEPPSIPYIVEKSKHIHEVCLRKVDPELALHLKTFEIPPQIFLIRWIRLLFSREFPFSDLLVFWDTLFAVDPNLELIDWICVAMILRIRWELIQSDNSGCLQLLLKYPVPSLENGPHTFVDDSLYLKLQMNAASGSYIVEKYSGKPITSMSQSIRASQSPSTPGFGRSGFNDRKLASRSSLGSPSRFRNQPGGMDAILQSAKGMLERGEKLGINRAVRDAVGEFKKNVQQLQEAARNSPIMSTESRLATLEKRNLQLSDMVGDILESLRGLSSSGMEDRAQSVDTVELLAAKLQFVKLSLEDSTIDIPDLSQGSTMLDSEDVVALEDVNSRSDEFSTRREYGDPVVNTAASLSSSSVIMNTLVGNPVQDSEQDEPVLIDYPFSNSTDISSMAIVAEPSLNPTIVTDELAEALVAPLSDMKAVPQVPQDSLASIGVMPEPLQSNDTPLTLSSRLPSSLPKVPSPIRQSISQSSLAWMLSPNDSPSETPMSSTPRPLTSPKISGNSSSHSSSRERNAFLFGKIATHTDDKATRKNSKELFGLEPMPKPKSKVKP